MILATLAKTFGKIGTIGISRYPEKHQIRIRLVNTISGICAIGPTIDFFRLNAYGSSAAVFAPVAALAYLSVPLVSQLRPTLYASRIWFLIVVQLVMIGAGSKEGVEFGSQFFLLTMSAMPVFLFDTTKKWTVGLGSILPCAVLVGQEATNYQLFPVDQKFTAVGTKYILIVGSAVVLFVIMKIFHDENAESETETQVLAEKAKTLEHLNNIKREFLARMSHELRTPLNIILGFSQALRQAHEKGDAHSTQEYLNEIDESGHHLLELINEILDLSKIESGKLAIDKTSFNLVQETEKVIEQMQPIAQQEGNELIFENHLTIEHVSSDRRKIKQILINLISNACKFTKSGKIRVELSKAATQDTSRISIVICDTGIGMTPEQVDIIFEPFRQVDTSTTRQYEGSGLGLSIVHHFVLGLGGSIDVQSTPGLGSRFIVTLPRIFVPRKPTPPNANLPKA
jgi:signal transduction histidine kinase